MVSFILSGLSAAALLFGLGHATPVKRQGVSTLDQCQFTSYKSFGYYAAAAYCPYPKSSLTPAVEVSTSLLYM